VQALGFFHESIEECKAIGELRCPFSVLGYAGIDEFLDEPILVTLVDAEAAVVSDQLL
jgi:hypothetical protein